MRSRPTAKRRTWTWSATSRCSKRHAVACAASARTRADAPFRPRHARCFDVMRRGGRARVDMAQSGGGTHTRGLCRVPLAGARGKTRTETGPCDRTTRLLPDLLTRVLTRRLTRTSCRCSFRRWTPTLVPAGQRTLPAPLAQPCPRCRAGADGSLSWDEYISYLLREITVRARILAAVAARPGRIRTPPPG